jgi:transposase
MKAYSEDLRSKIVEAAERGMSTSGAARPFGVGISSVKRHAPDYESGSSRRWRPRYTNPGPIHRGS